MLSAFAIAAFVLLPLVSINIGVGGGIAGEPAASIAMAGFHVVFFVLLVASLLQHRARPISIFSVRSLKARITIVILFATISAASVVSNAVGWSAFLRVTVVVLYLTNILLLYPLAIGQKVDSHDFSNQLQVAFLIIATALLGLAIFIFVTGQSPYYRLGYPLIPGVFAYYMTIAYLITLTTRKSTLLSLLFLTAIILSGSRSALAFSLAILIVIGARGNFVRLLFGSVTAAIIIGLFDIGLESIFRPFLIERADITAGRMLIWAHALMLVVDSPFLGYGIPQILDIPGAEAGLAAHNSFIDLSLTYGVVYALCAYVVWILVFMPRRTRKPMTLMQERRSRLKILKIALFGLVSFKSLVTTTFWTNMGDAATLFAVLILILPDSSGFFIRAKQLNSRHQRW